ncbi:hypothetical protein D3C78_1689310 [compost metagenome]
MLIGEERVPASLAKKERLHNRVLEWVPAQSATLEDMRLLATHSYPKLQIHDDLLEDLRRAVRGCLRRIVVNLYHVYSEASAMCLESIDLAQWGSRGWYTGEAPVRRRA